MKYYKIIGKLLGQKNRPPENGMADWKVYNPTISVRTEHFVIIKPPPTNEGRDTLLFMERMRELGYRFVVEGFSGLVFEITSEGKQFKTTGTWSAPDDGDSYIKCYGAGGSGVGAVDPPGRDASDLVRMIPSKKPSA